MVDYGDGTYGGGGATAAPSLPAGTSGCIPGSPRADLELNLDGNLDGRQRWGPFEAEGTGPQRYLARPVRPVGPPGLLQAVDHEFLIDGRPVKVAGTCSHGGGTHGAYNTGSSEIDESYPRAIDIREMARLRLKFCRLMFSYSDPVLYTDKFFDWLDEAVDAAEVYGVKLIPCMSTLPQDPSNRQDAVNPDASELHQHLCAVLDSGRRRWPA